MSDILIAYQTLENLTVTLTDTVSSPVTPSVWGLDAIKQTVETASLPVRILYPLSPLSDLATENKFIAIGKTATVTWQILDLLLWAPALSGLGVHSYADNLVEYIGAYAEAMRDIRDLAPVASGGRSQMTLIDVRYLVDHITWPLIEGSENVRRYAGVAVLLTARESLTS